MPEPMCVDEPIADTERAPWQDAYGRLDRAVSRLGPDEV